MLSSRTRRSSSRTAALLRLAATTVGGAKQRFEHSIVGCPHARVNLSPLRRPLVTLQHTPARHELQDEPGADKYEQQIRNIVAAP